MTENIRLERALGLWSVVLFGLAYMTPMIVFGTFGALASASQGTTAMAYLVAASAIFLTAASYGIMARVYPVAGSAYTYARKSLNSGVGFLVGWAVLLDYFFLPMVIWLIGAAYLTAAFPDVPGWLWVVGFIVVTTVVNLVGIVFANRVNLVLMFVQLAVLVAFVVLAGRYVVALNGPGGLASVRPFFDAGVPFGASVAGAAIAAYSFLGFDAVSTLTEETRDPTRTMPKAIMIIAAVGGVIFTGSAYITQLAHPGGDFASVDSAASEIALMIGGDLFVTVFLATLVVAQFTSGLAAQASVGRLLFAMGRDGVLPTAIFGRLHRKWHTPVANLVLVGIVGLLALTMDVTTSTSFINFGAFLAFTAVNVSVIALYLKGHSLVRPLGAFVGLIVPALGAACDLFLLWNLDGHAKMLGLLWLALGVGYLAYLTKFFQAAPPEMEFAE
ncbi:APC family permease [Shinella pollutisoli]|uniref:APC family permease n=1 Tax=Shinella pollutisoli TaxID=2250594 RepID=A0ABV7DLT0_9HYPH|nr:APC family permease [Shinella pollutisoli]